MSKFLEIQPAVITTFALSDLMGQAQKCHAPLAVDELLRLYLLTSHIRDSTHENPLSLLAKPSGC